MKRVACIVVIWTPIKHCICRSAALTVDYSFFHSRALNLHQLYDRLNWQKFWTAESGDIEKLSVTFVSVACSNTLC